MRVKGWVKELKKVVGSEIKLAIAGNKSDLEKQRVVSVKDAEEYAKTIGAGHFSTSARSVSPRFPLYPLSRARERWGD